MFARSSTIRARTSMIDDGIGYVRDTVMPAMTHLDGFVGLSLIVDRGSGRCIATSSWRTREAMRASAERVAPIRDGAAEAFGGPATVDEWAVSVLHRVHHARSGACLRATWTKTDPSRLDEAVDVFKYRTLGRIEDLPGFCSAALLVNRDDGRAVVTVGYDSRAALDRSREPGTLLRKEAASDSGMAILDVGEFDLELAHLRVPETV